MDDERFTFGAYLKDHIIHLVIALFAFFCVGAMIAVMGAPAFGVVWVEFFLVLCAVIILAVDFLRKQQFYQNTLVALQSLEFSYQFPALVEEPDFQDGRIAYLIGETVSRKASEEVTQARQQTQDYRSYIELWIHETKTPIAAAKLVLSSMHGSQATKLARELERIETQVDQALYYARSTSLANDYTIHEVPLTHVCREACKKHAQLLIESGTTPIISVDDAVEVLTDELWLTFMLGQVITNAAKYGATTLSFTSQEKNADTAHGYTLLQVADNGVGIPASDLSRVFERGFTGSNGHTQGSATGMGLYLVAVMAERMGISVEIASEENVGTRLLFGFPHDRRRLSTSSGRHSA